ncbi:MAG TPA: pilus (MSHA type) biogenesis protein MshL [Methylophilaceae bacterium]|jgi:general secretion pathway protein D
MNKTCIIFTIVALSGCAHESQVTPSTGHIDGQVNGQQTGKAADGGASAIPKPVKNTAFLPPPKSKAKEQTYSVVVNEVPVKEILFALARDSKLNIDIHPAIQGRVTLNAVDQTLPAILERLSKQVDLTYKIEGNVLSITPDLPVLRTYKVDYVNMSRDTTGSVGVAAEIAGTSGGGSSGTSGSSSSGSSGSSGGTTNSSKTLVSSVSKNHFWETLIANIKDILAETDKEVIISRNGSTAQSSDQQASSGNANAPNKAGSNAATNSSDSNSAQQAKQEKEEARTEYKTLFAATVIANPETGVISVRATNKQHEKIQEFLDKILSSARKQVLIEATIAEVTLNDSYQAGIDWSRLSRDGSADGLTFNQVLGPRLPSTSSPSFFSIGLKSTTGTLGTIASSIKLLSQFGDTKVLSSPKLMVLNNQTAVLKVVDNLVYFTIEASTSQAQTTSLTTFTTTPHTVPVGVVMSVTPQINDTGTVNINVRPTISRLIDFKLDPNPQLTNVSSGIPEIQVREMESILQVDSGNTAVLGGLMQDEVRRNADNVPGLSKLPYVGRLFSGKDDSNRKTELVIFLRPTVIQNASLESDELSAYKQYLPNQQLQQRLDESAN